MAAVRPTAWICDPGSPALSGEGAAMPGTWRGNCRLCDRARSYGAAGPRRHGHCDCSPLRRGGSGCAGGGRRDTVRCRLKPPPLHCVPPPNRRKPHGKDHPGEDDRETRCLHRLRRGGSHPAARPPIGAAAKTLIFVPQANLTSLDPVWTTATVTRNFALMVYENLYGRDQSFNPQPQMVEGHTIDNDGRRWTMKLREGLLFHDGTPVLARDCVASLQRWLKRDAVSETMDARVDAIE